MASEYTIAVGLGGLLLGIGAGVLTFGRAEGRRDQRLDDHEHRLQHQANKIAETQRGSQDADRRLTTVEQTLAHMSKLLGEVRDDVKALLRGVVK